MLKIIATNNYTILNKDLPETKMPGDGVDALIFTDTPTHVLFF